jgi:hypothetical protein
MSPAWPSSKLEGSGSDCPRFRDQKTGLLVTIRFGQVSCLIALSIFSSGLIAGRFASAASGTPMLLRDADVNTDYPKDVDDENITHQGLSPTLPGELTKVSSALALFKGSRILAKTLEELYPASMTYQLSLKKLRALADELDQWSQDLPSHLRLQFLNDKPSTGVVGCRSPLLVRSPVHGFSRECEPFRLTRHFPVACLLLHPQPHPPSTRLPWVWDCRVDIHLGDGRFRQAHRPDTGPSRRTTNELHLSLQ